MESTQRKRRKELTKVIEFFSRKIRIDREKERKVKCQEEEKAEA